MLLARPLINYDECLLSYLIRVSEQNGFKHVGHLLNYAGLNWKNNRVPVHHILSGEFNLSSLFSTMGLPEPHSKIAPIHQSSRPVIDTPHVIVKYPRVCPDCLEELGYSKFQWAFFPINACTTHKKMLVDISPKSGRKLSWYRQHLTRFDGELNVIGSTDKQAALASVEQSEYIESFLLDSKLDREPPAILNGLEFREALSLIHFIAHYQFRMLGDYFNPAAMNNNELSKVYENVWLMLKDWPYSFYALLEQFINKPMSNKGQSGLNKHFRDLYERLYRQKINMGIARIKIEFDLYINKYWLGLLEPKRIKRIQLDTIPRNIISKNYAAKILGTRLKRIDKLVQQRRLTTLDSKGKKYYQRNQVEALRNKMSSNWSMAQACNTLELSRYKLKQLLDANIITVLQRPSSLNRDWVIDKAQCLSLLRKLKKKAHKPAADSSGISMEGIQRSGYSIVQLVLAMLNGELEYGIRSNIERAKSIKQFTDFKIKKKL